MHVPQFNLQPLLGLSTHKSTIIYATHHCHTLYKVSSKKIFGCAKIGSEFRSLTSLYSGMIWWKIK